MQFLLSILHLDFSSYFGKYGVIFSEYSQNPITMLVKTKSELEVFSRQISLRVLTQRKPKNA